MFSQGFSVIDVRDPRAPRAVGTCRAPTGRGACTCRRRGPAARRERAGSLPRKSPRGRPAVLLGLDERRLAGESAATTPRVYASTTPPTRRAARDRFRPDRRCRRASRLVHRRPLGVRLGDARRLQRLRLHGARYRRSDGARGRRVVLASRHAHRGRRDADLGRATLLVPSRHRLGRHRLRDLAGRRRDAGRRLRSLEPQPDRASQLVPTVRRRTHNALPLPDRDLMVVVDESVLERREDGVKHIWIFDIREPSNPVSISTLPVPDEDDYIARGGRFGPHNVHENRPGASSARRPSSAPTTTRASASTTSRIRTGRRRSQRSSLRFRSG